MKVLESTLVGPGSAARTNVAAAVAELIKARLTALVLVTTGVGFYLGGSGGLAPLLFLNTMIGTGLLAAGAAALNQVLERDYDALMPRTAHRPLPSGQMTLEAGVLVGVGLSVAGVIYLSLSAGLGAGVLGSLTLGLYLFVYTPLKRTTPWNTVVGAVPGALPPVIGWVAARGELDAAGCSLFAILYFWQLPHFLAIAWIYREQYNRAGFEMMPRRDPHGWRTRKTMLVHTAGLVVVSLAPFALGLTGAVYAAGAAALGGGFCWFTLRFWCEVNRLRARQLFLYSIFYLPGLMTLMVMDKIA